MKRKHMLVYLYVKILLFISLIVTLVHSCAIIGLPPAGQVGGPDVSALSSEYIKLSERRFSQVFAGDMLSKESLVKAALQSLDYFKKLPADQEFLYGNLTYKAAEMAMSTQIFLDLLQGPVTQEAFLQAMDEKFLLFESAANSQDGVLFTGYYEPIFPGSLKRDKSYKIPVYDKPPDLQVLELGQFRNNLKNRTIVFKSGKGQPEPYYTRKQIMGDQVLAGKGLELAWLKDPLDLFFMQVQGSGIIETPQGVRYKLGYNGANGRPYSSIGKYLVDLGYMELDKVSMQSIRDFLGQNPHLRDQVIYHNESYVFFKIEDYHEEGPRGNINLPLTTRRSVATDAGIFPKGALVYFKTELPQFDANWELVGNQPAFQFAMIQDTGGAIRGPGRVDIFWGNGKLAEKSAGVLRAYGELYFLVARPEVLTRPATNLASSGAEIN